MERVRFIRASVAPAALALCCSTKDGLGAGQALHWQPLATPNASLEKS